MKRNVLLAMVVGGLMSIGMSAYADVSGNAPVISTANTISTTQGATMKTEQEIMLIKTSKGTLTVELYPEDAPQTVANFKKLSQEGFYNGLKFHRVIPGFVAQGGDPQTKGVMGKDWTADPSEAAVKKIPLAGTGGPGYTVKAEFNKRKHLTGTLAMARSSDPNSAGSQFYICLAPQAFLDGNYTVFGQVTDGMDAVMALQIGDTIESITIAQPATIVSEPDTTTANAVPTPNSGN